MARDTKPYNMEGERYWSLQHGGQEILVVTTWKVRDTGPYNMEGKRYWSLQHGR
jgi:hypothetical protein